MGASRMGKKGFNWKARKVVKTLVDNSVTKKIDLELPLGGHYDQSNQLILPSKKRKTSIKENKPKVTRILSKKHRKRLEKIVEKKKKKENRSSLLDALQQVKATPEEAKNFLSISAVQTKGLKRYFQEENNPDKVKIREKIEQEETVIKLNSISGAKRLKLLQNNAREDKAKSSDPNIVGFETSESESDSDESVKKEEIIVEDTKKEEIKEKIEKKVEETLPPKITKEKIKEILPKKPSVFVDIIRSESIQKARLKLPILAEEQQIMEIINENSVIIIAGETGSGKTTQVPQFLYEAGYALNKQICVTEPRRVAAIAMSKRVAEEMNLSTKEVSYLIRFEGNATEDTKIKFMTDGVLLRELQTDFLLRKYSVIILDEAHERSVYTDILIGLLSRIVPLRAKKLDPLKLIIMSATLRLEDFVENKRLFKLTPPTIKVDTRQFPVTVHFNKRTNEDYLKEAFNKVVKINTKLPDGGVLVFVTGQQEVNSLVRKLRKAFPLRHKSKILEKAPGDDEEGSDEEVEQNMARAIRKKKRKIKVIPEINLDDYSIPGDLENASDLEEEEESDEDLDETGVITNAQPLWTLPLYSLLPSHKQAKVFEPPPPGCRLCIVSTNVAETSLTIPNIKYVVDTGKAKVKLYDKTTGVTSYVVHWTSKASANQRAGRAGRLGPGHCYRLFSSAVFNDSFEEFSVPEIQTKPVDDLFLQMKCMNIDKVVNFPFPTPPDLVQLQTAEQRLEVLGALVQGKVTGLGRAIAKFPVMPRFGKMLALSHQQNLLPYTISLVAALSVQEVLLEVPILTTSPEENKMVRQKWFCTRKSWAGQGNSLLLGDPMVLLRAVGAAEYANSQGKLEEFCNENGLRHKALTEIRKLRLQLTNEIRSNLPEADITVDPKLAPPSDLQAKLLRQILLAGMGDQLARKVQLDELGEVEDKNKFKFAYKANNMEDPVFLHQTSVLKRTLPEFVVYQELYETNKIYMRGVTAIEADWLPIYVPKLCNLSEPLTEPPPFFKESTGKVHCTVSGTFGSQAWPLPAVEIVYPSTINYYKFFGKFLLEGVIFERLSKYKSTLLSQPSIMTKSWAKLQPRTDVLVKALMSKDVKSKATLEEIWRKEPKFLLSEFLRWMPESAYSEVSLMWPPLDQEK